MQEANAGLHRRVPTHLLTSNNPSSTSKKNCGDEERFLYGAVEKPTDKTVSAGDRWET
jgi:hypothetical protein